MLVAIGTPTAAQPEVRIRRARATPQSARRSSTRNRSTRGSPSSGNGMVTIFTGKVELGTGVSTTAMQLVADELDVPLAKIKVVEGDTWRTRDQGFTAGSQSNKTQYAATGALRQAAAEARLALLNMASETARRTGRTAHRQGRRRLGPRRLGEVGVVRAS